MNRLFVVFPLYRQMPVSFFANWLQVDKTHIFDTASPPLVERSATTNGASLPQAMRLLVAQALSRDDWDRLVVVEQDMIMPRDGFNRMAEYHPDWDIVGATYFQRSWPHNVHAYLQVKPPYFSPLSGPAIKELIDEPGLYPVHAVGFGFTSIARHVLEDWDESKQMFEPTPPMEGHDFQFCTAAREQGYSVWIDTGLGCSHITEAEIGIAEHEVAQADCGLLTWDQAEAVK